MRAGGARRAALLVVAAGAAASCVGFSGEPQTDENVTVTPAATDAVVIAAGDIAQCSSTGDEETAALVAANPTATVLTLGDNAYPKGSARDFASCYHPSWGTFKARTRPVPGNHEYRTDGAADYFTYFGAAAGDPTKGYYSFNLGMWHIVALNSNCKDIACEAGSAQEQWLRADLAANRHLCKLAYFHHPRFSSGQHGASPLVDGLWQALYDGGVDVVLNGHDHNYERFAKQNPDGVADVRGIRQFVVGTGGAERRQFRQIVPNSQVRHDASSGVLRLKLRTNAYEWQFLPGPGTTFTDSGVSACT